MASRPSPAPPRRLKLEPFLRRAAFKRRLLFVLGCLLFAAFVFADRAGWLLHQSSEWKRYDEKTFRVVRVVDGDTLDIDIPSGRHPSTRLRLWGVDTPETAKPREGKASEPFADDAWAFTRMVCEGKQVTVRLEAHQLRDRYDRLLAYIELPDGSTLNEQLLLEGLARFESRFPHRHLERYELLEKQAKFEKKGMWKK
jgi:micrococcal nuclease